MENNAGCLVKPADGGEAPPRTKSSDWNDLECGRGKPNNQAGAKTAIDMRGGKSSLCRRVKPVPESGANYSRRTP